MLSRRAFLTSVLAAGCGGSSVAAAEEVCGLDPLTRGARVPLGGEGMQLLDVPVGDGLDGRLYTDLSRLGSEGLVVPTEHFYIRTRVPDRIDYSKPWRIRTSSLGGVDVDLPIADLSARARAQPETLLECSGNAIGGSFGLMSAARWTGVPVGEVLASIDPTESASLVLVSGFDEHSRASERSIAGASWIFRRRELEAAGAFLAITMNDAPLPADHGFPVRLVVPGWYGCTCIKWVDAIRFVGDDEPSTAHMREFASRTHQDGTPALAREFRAASIDLAAMPVRVERVMTDAGERLFVTGVYWGGDRPEAELDLLVAGRPTRVQICARRASQRTWGLWSATIAVPPPGSYPILLRSADRAVPTKRLDTGYYARAITIT